MAIARPSQRHRLARSGSGLGSRAIIWFSLSLLLAPPALAAPASRELDDAVERGLDYLASQQGVDGSLADKGPKVALTSLGLLAFLAAGDVPELGKYGATVREAIDFIVQRAPADGYFGRLDGSRMYGQAITTLALTQAWSVEENAPRRAALGEVVRHAARVLIDAQNVRKPPEHEGGWRYEPESADSDLSVSQWSMLALRACAGAGVEIPRDSVSRSVGFLLKCRRADGGFTYQAGAGDASPGSTGAALLCLALLDASRRSERVDAQKFLRDHPVDEQARFPYYSTFFVAEAALQETEGSGPSMAAPLLQKTLRAQGPDGSWPQSRSSEEPGVTYATAMALLSLESTYRLLPAFQR